MRRRLSRFILVILFILAALYFSQHKQWLNSFSSIFTSQPYKIDNTVILVREINNLAQLVTITAYNEIAIDSTKKGWALFNNPLIPTLLNINIKQPDQKLTLIAKGKILAGVNLSKLKDGDIFIKGDSVSITLPKSEILQVILNPSGFDIFEEKGEWTDEEVKSLKIKAKDKLAAHAMQQDILNKASAKAVTIMENFLRATGFNKIAVFIKS